MASLLYRKLDEDTAVIKFTNRHRFEYMLPSGTLGFGVDGWPWERPAIALGLMKPELFTIVIKSLTRYERIGNLRWHKPWECVRPLPNKGVVNKVGLTNDGIEWWCAEVGPRLDYRKYSIVGSIFAEGAGAEDELVEMALMLESYDFVGLEVNVSCPNTGHEMSQAAQVVKIMRAVKKVSRHPLIIKVSADPEKTYLGIAMALAGIAEAISLNSVPWKTVYGNQRSPLWKLEERVGGGGGGVSGRPAQKYNWQAVYDLAGLNALPVIAPSIMEYGDVEKVRALGAKALSFGAINLPDHPVWLKPWTIFTNPCKATRIVKKDMLVHGPVVKKSYL